jgi:hypothetical protein
MGTGFLSFIRAFGVRWFVAMSGPLSVPLALAGYFAPGELAKIGLFATALFCAVFSSYWVWKVEREARNAAERKIAEFETGTAVLAALNDVFNQTHQLSNSAVTTADEYEAWKANINSAATNRQASCCRNKRADYHTAGSATWARWTVRMGPYSFAELPILS